ncbi:acyltransferase [Cellulophaga sp. BC115SP]|nr:acyltransferase [Cellulophaga sp. BC115SP]NBB31619.1 acyltransferase [Cellulophaga sp. BC115SP]
MISLINSLLIKVFNFSLKTEKSNFFLSWVKIPLNNECNFNTSLVYKSRVSIYGLGNRLIFKGCELRDSNIVVHGKNNVISISTNVKLRSSNIIIRGSNCKVEIGEFTTFGGVRIINVGVGNSVTIGNRCLLSDKIEIWASDTHSIYDKNRVWVNPERPISIGNDVWIGSGVTILKGVTVFDGAIIGMGSVVTKDVENNSISVGNPLRTIRRNVSWSIEYPTDI